MFLDIAKVTALVLENFKHRVDPGANHGAQSGGSMNFFKPSVIGTDWTPLIFPQPVHGLSPQSLSIPSFLSFGWSQSWVEKQGQWTFALSFPSDTVLPECQEEMQVSMVYWLRWET